MRAVPVERLLEIFKAEGMNLFRPHIDGILLTESFDDAARNQHGQPARRRPHAPDIVRHIRRREDDESVFCKLGRLKAYRS